MAHRKTTPICKHCDEKPVRVLGFFCTMRCAATEGQHQLMHASYMWCDWCGEWHDDLQAEYCEEDRNTKGGA